MFTPLIMAVVPSRQQRRELLHVLLDLGLLARVHRSEAAREGEALHERDQLGLGVVEVAELHRELDRERLERRLVLALEVPLLDLERGVLRGARDAGGGRAELAEEALLLGRALVLLLLGPRPLDEDGRELALDRIDRLERVLRAELLRGHAKLALDGGLGAGGLHDLAAELLDLRDVRLLLLRRRGDTLAHEVEQGGRRGAAILARGEGDARDLVPELRVLG